MSTVIFTPLARAELIEAQDWYENRAHGLGSRFRDAVDAVVLRMIDNPRLYRPVYKSVRRALIRRFPYALMFVIEADESITVIACFHGSRDPARWRERM